MTPADAASPPPVLADLGESGLLARVFPLLPVGAHTLLGPGDDAAVVAAPDGRVVATADVLVEGRDFRRDWSSAQDVGWKAAAQNLADVAAMGAVPTSLLVSLVAPATLPVDWVLDLVRGLADACEGTGAGVVGGDLSSGDAITVAVTALGDLQGRTPVLRSGAQAGQDVALAGVLGLSAGGLQALRAWGPDVAAGRCPYLLAAHRRPRPPYGLGPVAAAAGATAMLDISDGLLRDAARVAAASDVAIDLDEAALGWYVERLRPAAQAHGVDPWQWVLGGGEDHGLLAVFASGQAPDGFIVIGRTQAASGGPAVTVNGRDLFPGSGWDHFTTHLPH